MPNPKSKPQTKPQDDMDPGERTAAAAGLPHQRVLFDFDPTSRDKGVLGGDPADLSGLQVEAVRSMSSGGIVLTIYAHAGQGQDMADLLARRTDLLTVAAAYAQSYQDDPDVTAAAGTAVPDFRLYPLTSEEKANIQANTGFTLPPGFSE